MNKLYLSKTYISEIKSLSKSDIFSIYENKTILIAGGTGLILSYLIDVLLIEKSRNLTLILVVRDKIKAKERFSYFENDNRIKFIEDDIKNIMYCDYKLDLIINGASKTDPYNYANYPVEVLIDNVVGSNNLLNLSKLNNAKYVMLSSCEVYGLNNNETLSIKDNSIINSLEVRSCYNLAKLSSENLCISYNSEYGIDYKIIRYSRIFGPTIKTSDTKALSQFLFKALNREDVVLKSNGQQLFSYQYVADAIRALTYLINSTKYNVVNSNNEEVYQLRQLAEFIASLSGNKVIYDINDDFNNKGYSKSKNSVLDISELKELGFENKFNIFDSLYTTFKILKELK